MQIFNTHNKSDHNTLISKQNLNHNSTEHLVEGLTNRNGCYKDIETNDFCSKQDMKAYFSVHWLKGKSELIYNVWCLK